jgi:hypothetical protein
VSSSLSPSSELYQAKLSKARVSSLGVHTLALLREKKKKSIQIVSKPREKIK